MAVLALRCSFTCPQCPKKSCQTSRRIEVPIPDVVEEQGRHVDQAVDAVQKATVAEDHRPHVFDPQVALDDADNKVAQLPTDADDQAGDKTVPRLEVRESEEQSPWQQEGYHQGTGGTFPGLLWTDVATEHVPAKQLAAGV